MAPCTESRWESIENHQRAVLALSALYGALHHYSTWYTTACVIVAVGVVLVFPRHRTNCFAFWTMGCACLAAAVFNWESADNHKYLGAYWLLGVGVWLAQNEGQARHQSIAQLRTMARSLVAVSMGLAAAWKLGNPQFVSGEFFELTLLTDERFAAVARVCGVSVDGLAWNDFVEDEVLEGGRSLPLVGIAHVRPAAIAFTVWSALVEVAIALLFALSAIKSGRKWLSGLGDVLLLTFLCTTYLIAPVAGFGTLLSLLGLAQAEQRTTQFAYLATVLVVVASSGPGATLLQWWSGQ